MTTRSTLLLIRKIQTYFFLPVLAYNPLLKFYVRITNFFSFLFLRQKKKNIKPQKILLSNIAHLGDLVLTSCVIEEIKKSYPNAKIGLLSSSCSHQVLKGHCGIDYYHTFDHWKLSRINQSFLIKIGKSLFSFFRAYYSIREIGYTHAVDLYPYYPNTSLLLFSSKIPIRIGFSSGGWGGTFTSSLEWHQKKQHITDHFFQLLEVINIPKPTTRKFSLPQIIEEKTICPFEEYLVIHMGAGDRQKEWDPNQWKQLIQQLHIPIVFTGRGDREKKLAQEMSKGENYVDRLNWKEFVSVISRAKMVISVDSVSIHIAAAQQIPTIGIYLSDNNPYLWRPYNDNSLCFVRKAEGDKREALLIFREQISYHDLLEAIATIEQKTKKAVLDLGNSEFDRVEKLPLQN